MQGTSIQPVVYWGGKNHLAAKYSQTYPELKSPSLKPKDKELQIYPEFDQLCRCLVDKIRFMIQAVRTPLFVGTFIWAFISWKITSSKHLRQPVPSMSQCHPYEGIKQSCHTQLTSPHSSGTVILQLLNWVSPFTHRLFLGESVLLCCLWTYLVVINHKSCLSNKSQKSFLITILHNTHFLLFPLCPSLKCRQCITTTITAEAALAEAVHIGWLL